MGLDIASMLRSFFDCEVSLFKVATGHKFQVMLGAAEAKAQRSVNLSAQLDQQDAQLGSVWGEAISAALVCALNPSSEAKFAQIVTVLSHGVSLGFETIGLQDSLMESGLTSRCRSVKMIVSSPGNKPLLIEDLRVRKRLRNPDHAWK